MWERVCSKLPLDGGVNELPGRYCKSHFVIDTVSASDFLVGNILVVADFDFGDAVIQRMPLYRGRSLFSVERLSFVRSFRLAVDIGVTDETPLRLSLWHYQGVYDSREGHLVQLQSSQAASIKVIGEQLRRIETTLGGAVTDGLS